MMNWFELPPNDPKLPPPEFVDIEGARAWLGRQPQAMPARLQAALAEQVERLSACNMPAFTRASLLETLRNTAVMAQGAVRRKFAFAPRPLAGDAHEAFVLSARLWSALAGGYLTCFDALASESPAVDRQIVATAAHRALLTCRLALEDHFVAGVETPDLLWYRLHRLMQATTALGIADLAIADPEFRDPRESTPTEQYALAALLSLSDPYRLNASSYAVTQRALARWRGQVSLAATSNEDPRMRWVPLNTLAPVPPAGEGSPAWLEVHQVRRKLRKRIEALDAGESPESLHLGRELAGSACRELLASILDHLRAAYSESQEKPQPVNSDCELAVGPAGCFELLANRPFSASKSLSATSSRIMHDRIAMFGASERVETVARPERASASGEAWHLKGESVRIAELWRAAGGSNTRVLPGQLVLFRDDRGSASLAVVARAWVCRDGRCEISLRRLPGRPEALTAQAADLPTEPPFPAFLLPAVAAVGTSASVLLPTGIASRLRYGLDARGESSLRCSLGKLVERGADFERYAFTPR